MMRFAPLLPLVLIMAVMQWAGNIGWVPSYLLPRPSEVWSVLIEDRIELLSAALTTFSSACLGLFASVLVGSIIALVMSINSVIKRALYPYAVFFQTVPIIAIAPILVIWFGFGQPTVIASSFICAVFPMMASTLLGLESTDPALVDLFKLYSAGSFKTLWKLRLPYALPQFFSGLRIASGLAVIGAIVGEFIGGGGLGSIVDAARTQQRIDKVFAAVLISSVLGILLVSAINTLSHWALSSWHASEKQ